MNEHTSADNLKGLRADLMRVLNEGTPEEKREARGLLATIAEVTGEGEATYVHAERPEGSGTTRIERGRIDMRGNRIPER